MTSIDSPNGTKARDVEDVKLLLESLEYQSNDTCQQQQALRALAAVLSQNGIAQDFFCSSRGLEFVLNLFEVTNVADICQSAMNTLALAVEGNNGSQKALTKERVFHMLRTKLQSKQKMVAATSAFLLLSICANQCEGQKLARETKCLHSLCDLFKSCLPVQRVSPERNHSGEGWFIALEDNNCRQLWNCVVVAIDSLLQNPQNVENQRVGCRLLPMIIKILQSATTQQDILLTTTTLAAAIISGNVECQSKMRLLGGLRALVNLLRKLIYEKQPTDENLSVIGNVLNTIASAIDGHELQVKLHYDIEWSIRMIDTNFSGSMQTTALAFICVHRRKGLTANCQDSAADLEVIPLLLSCLEISQSPTVSSGVAKHFRTNCILALSICVDHCEQNQEQLRDKGGVALLVELLTFDQSEEFRRVTIFVLHCITEKSPRCPEMVKSGGEPHDQITKQASKSSRETRDAETQTEIATQTAPSVCSECSSAVINLPADEVMSVETEGAYKNKPRRKSRSPSKLLKSPSKSTSCALETLNGIQEAEVEVTECVACERPLNSKSFLRTLRTCSKLCSYHVELGQFLHQKLCDWKREKHTRPNFPGI